MVNNVKYAILMILLIGIAKLLQVTLLGTDQYYKNEGSISKPYLPVKSNNGSDKTNEKSITQVKDSVESTLIEKAPEQKENTGEDASIESTEGNKSESAKSSRPSFDELKNNYLTPIISKLPPGQLREDVVIRYYKHKKDGDKVYVLSELGYYIHEKEATETAGMGSNVLYYGDGIPLEDIQIVAFALLENGLPIKAIKHSRYDWKFNSMEIGTDTLMLDAPILTFESITNFRK